jgi:hypothetical protein
MSSKNNSFVKSLLGKSKRDLAIMLQSLKTNLSGITPQIEIDVEKIGSVSSQLEEAKRNVEKLTAELSTIQANARKNSGTQKRLTAQIENVTTYLQNMSKASEKTAYVNRCIDYIMDYHEEISKFHEYYQYYGRLFLNSISTYEFTKDYFNNNVSDDEIIKIAHLIHVIQLYDEFECANKHFEVDSDREILFSELKGCNGYHDNDSDDNDSDEEGGFCCHKRFAYTIGSLDSIILYKAQYVNFSIDTTIDAVIYTRLN